VSLTALSNFLPVLLYLFSAGLMLFARARGWTQPELPATPEPAEPPGGESETLTFRERIIRFLRENRWGLILACAVLFLLSFTIWFAPPRINGAITPDLNRPGRPFYSLHWERAFLHDHIDAVMASVLFLFSAFCVTLIVIALRRRSLLHAEVSLLVASVTLAILAQANLAKEVLRNEGATLYVAAGFGLLYWAWLARKRLAPDLEPAPASRSTELILVVFLVALTAFGRFYVLDAVPYGIEGDEAKWTAEAVNLDVLGHADTSGEYHRDALPVSFYLQAPFHRLLGPSQFAARAAVAFLSVLASLAFFWLLRQMSSLSFATLATFLLSISIFDISASRLANVESFVKIGAILPLSLLAYALKDKPWQAYGLAGIALALATLTYDTLWPIVGVCLMLFLIEIRRQTIPIQEKVKSFAALFVPTGLALPLLVPYYVSRIGYYEVEKKGWDGGLFGTLWIHFVNVLQSWFVALRPDFLYNRAGALLNSALLPWLALGAIAAIVLVHARGARWMLVWVALVVFPVPILTNSPMGRVFYPGLPAVYALVALGMILFWTEIQRVVSRAYQPALIAMTVVVLFWLPFTNFYIYFNEVSDPADRQMRREIGDIMAESASPGTLILLPVIPGADEPLNNEYQMMDLFLLKRLTPQQAAHAYRRVALEDTLATIDTESANFDSFVIVLDKTDPARPEDRAALAAGLQNCYPLGRVLDGMYFQRFVIEPAALKQSVCTPVRLSLLAAQPPELYWKLSSGKASILNLNCSQESPDLSRVEAEGLPIAPGWQTEINFAAGWSGSGFLLDNFGSQPLTYTITSTFTKPEIYVWIRLFKRVVDHSPGMLTVNDVTRPFSESGDALNTWIWERVGPFPNIGSTVRITIARPYNDDPAHFMALFLDSLVISNDAALTPDANTLTSLPPQGFLIPGGNSSGTISANLAPGQYSCRLELQSSSQLVDDFGRQPIFSNNVDFRIP
jgi:4-amino-4-deoxy-L-arabinose transferase-like glycosyltransferase